MQRAVTAEKVRSHKPKLGQHFLTDAAAATRIADALGDISQSTVLEIGPGRGALTSLLANRARRLIAIELDRVLAAQLRMKFSTTPNVEIIEGDILAIDFHTLFGPKPGSSRPGLVHTPEPARVVGNIPYYITSDILLRLFEFRQYFSTIVIMVQREVADRITAKPGGSEYGLLSATAQLYTIRLNVSPRLASLKVPEEGFIDFLKLSFGQKRKTLWNNLKLSYQPEILKAALQKTGIKPTVRAEALTLEKSAALFRTLSSSAPAAPSPAP